MLSGEIIVSASYEHILEKILIDFLKTSRLFFFIHMMEKLIIDF